jgi:methylase of polypeptide subunit release factors
MQGAELLPTDHPPVQWTQDGQPHLARWLSPAGAAAPRRVVAADDTLKADAALRLISEGTAVLWLGDFHNARQLLQALARRVDEKAARAAAPARKAAAAAKGQAKPDRAVAAGLGTAPLPPPATPGAPAPAGAAVPAHSAAAADPALAFHRHRQAQAHRARILGGVLLPLTADGRIPLRRAPDARAALAEALGPAQTEALPLLGDAAGADDATAPGDATDAPIAALLSLRELQGLIGAHEWRKKGVPIAALGAAIHPHHGVFSPARGEYVDLVARAPLPAALAQGGVAWDIGTGTGVLAAVLARRGVPQVVATDQDPRALACAADNLARLGLGKRVTLLQADLFPAAAAAPPVSAATAAQHAAPAPAPATQAPDRAALIVCNPPWVPAKPASPIEAAVYDPDSRMLRGFLAGAAAHLAEGGEAWLILSDLAEHLGLRSREQLLGWMAAGGLQVLGRLDARPRHPKAADRSDPLHAARAAEVTSLWRLGRA